MDQAEKLRNVIKLKNQKLPQKARVITVTSGKGGVGKSSVTVNLAIQLQKMNKKVIILMLIWDSKCRSYAWSNTKT